jgi:hypothetical protein
LKGNEDWRFIFVSYAYENFALAEWLTLRLTALGYEVWCDQIKLLGGESYPKDIDAALENSFRVLHLVSQTSKDKDNPVKERTKALQLGKARRIDDFLIPLNVDGIRPEELNWMVSDLSYIAFNRNWADGLARLVKKLESVNAPRRRTDGLEAVRHYFDQTELVKPAAEPVWSNLLDVLELPRTIFRVRGSGFKPPDWSGITYYQDGLDFWTFQVPRGEVEIDEYECDLTAVVGRLPLLNPITYLIRKHIANYVKRKGLTLVERARKRGEFYFPSGLVPDNRLYFQVPGQRRRWIQPVGERTFRSGATKEKSRHHLSFGLRPMLRTFDSPAIQVQLAVWLTDLDGKPLKLEAMNRRRKQVCRRWFNEAWFTRTVAVVAWLADGKDTFEVFRSGKNAVVLAGRPLRLSAPISLDESRIRPPPEDDESEEIDEFAELFEADEDNDEFDDSDTD